MDYSKWDKLTEEDEDEGEDNNKISTGHGDNLSFLTDPMKKKEGPMTIEEMMTALNMTPGQVAEKMKSMNGVNVGGVFSGGIWQDGKELRERHQAALREHIDKGLYKMTNTSIDPISSGFISSRDAKSLRVLKSVKDLKVGQINAGVILWCTVIEPVFRVVGLQVIVEDVQKNIFLIAAYNFVSSAISLSDCQKTLPVGCRIGMKEPYLKCYGTGYLGLRVDNPINMEVVIDGSEASTSTSTSISIKQSVKGKSSLDYKNEGNEFFKKQEYKKAIVAYSVGISTITTQLKDPMELRVALLNNRCTCYLKTRQYIEALSDARSVLQLQPSNAKAAFKEADSLFGLRRYGDSDEKFEALQGRKEINKQELQTRRDAILRLIVQSYVGQYQESDFRIKVTSYTLHSELEDYFGPIRIGQSTGKGRGVFASEDISKGELILVEKPFVTTDVVPIADTSSLSDTGVFTYQIPTVDLQSRTAYSAENEKLIFNVIEKAKGCKAHAARLSVLYDGTNSHDRIIPSLDFFRYDDDEMILSHSGTISAEKIRKIISFNVFGDSYPDKEKFDSKEDIMKQSTSSLFIVTSLFNHSKTPNIVHTSNVVGGVMRLVASKDIKKGDELCIIYTEGDVSKWGIHE